MPFIGPKVRELSGRLIPTSPARQVSGRCGHRPLREGEALTIHPSGILEFLFVFIVDFFELYVYNKVNKSQLRRNLT